MRFNLKITEYKDTATITTFDSPVGFDDDFNFIRITSDKKERAPREPEIEVYTGKEAWKNEVEEEMERKRIQLALAHKNLESLEKSMQRTKRNILVNIRSMNLDNAYFITLTFDKKKVDRTNFTRCCAKTRNWLQNIKKKFAPEMQYVCVPELHKDDVSWHMHGILSNVDGLNFADSGHKDFSGRIIFNISNWKLGFSTAVKILNSPESSVKISRYITKYITKESNTLAHNKHRYFASQNIPKPRVRKYMVENDIEKDSVLAELFYEGYKEVSSKRYEGFTGMNYTEVVKVK